MKKVLATVLVLAVGMLFAYANVGAITVPYTGSDGVTAGTGINGSVHDLRRHNMPLPQAKTGYQSKNATATGNDYLDRLCIFCHAPHHSYKLLGDTNGTGPESATADFKYLPLWNHKQTVASFTQYNPGPDAPDADLSMKGPQSVSGSLSTFVRVTSVSLLCLSCHDGSVAINEFGNTWQDPRSRSGGGDYIDSEYAIGYAGPGGTIGYLQNHHPISFSYDAVSSFDLEILPMDVATYEHTPDAIYGAANQINVAVDQPIQNYLYGADHKMECATCHAVHNTGNTGEKLLYVSDQNSNLCFTCHWKGTKTGDSTFTGGQINATP